MRIKVRAEMQLEIGDKVDPNVAAIEAGNDWIRYMEGRLTGNPDMTATPSIIDVTRGKMAFVIEKG